ncbi:FG-GAP repeat domain-containing protein [Histidinibacterium lentulum]|uniref:VCBS repeat-containing protein n=1 Tax=Histidinibacterium lentulum TaxID=2480588 RepID=A0A3N2QYG0_9RHOB|nr:VCBS repeat-containing protein [Histidinibacterium lentulum]ROU00245.1 VCBS repeat-containing protein [Histidinibacterium lentulum]
MRGGPVLWALTAVVWAGAAAAEAAPGVVAAEYLEPTDRYPHGVLGDDLEWGALRLVRGDGSAVVLRLPEARVFEDTAPRVEDVTGDGRAEVVVVESDAELGARLAIYDGAGDLLAATPHIGTRFRWLAPVGIADLDGDGHVEIAYVDRPHLAKVLRVWRVRGAGLEEVGSAGGLTNHRIGEADIGGGLRLCGGRVEMITASADWARVIATRLTADGRLESRDMGPHADRESLAAAMRC